MRAITRETIHKNFHQYQMKKFLKGIFSLLVFFAISFILSTVSVKAQDNSLPGAEYDWGIALLRDGRHADAAKQFESELRGGMKIATERWIDAISYAAMLGETQYQMGQLPAALESFSTAIRLSIQHASWPTKVSNIPNPGMFTLKAVPWVDPTPNRNLMRVPEKFSILFGDLYHGNKYRTGGIAMAPSMKSIRATKIFNGTMLAIRRRAELLGPLGAGDELNSQLLTQLTQVQRSLAGTWFQAWLEIEIGLCHLSAGKQDDAIQSLMRGALINGNAHPLTPISYVELGKLQMKSGHYEKAFNLFLDAATIAYHYENVEMMTEAFELLENAYCQRNPQMVCPQLGSAAEWAKAKDLPLLYATLQALRVNDFMRFKQVRPALEALAIAEKTIAKQDVSAGRIGAILNYQRARIALLDPTPQSQRLGMESLSRAMNFMRFGAVWNFHLQQVDIRLLNGQLTTRKALDAYQLLLREPTAVDWSLNPIESLAVSMTPRPGTWENFFLCAVDMEKKEEALEISERAKCAAYLQSLDFGGRMHSLRLLLESPENDLTVSQLQRKRDILTEYPNYEVCSQKVRNLQMKIRQMSLPVTQKDDGKTLTEALKEVTELSRRQEAILSAIVLDRRVIDVVFPKIRTTKEIQASLPKGEAMLVYFAARNQLFLFLLNNERMAMWKIVDSGAGIGSSRKNKSNENLLTSLQLNFASMLKEMGLGSGNIRPEILLETNWKKAAQRVMADLTKNSQANFASADFTSLVIVPDRFAWYVPFETLLIQTPKGARPTISQFAIRYAPMASLGTPWKNTQLPKSPYSMIVGGKNMPSEKIQNRFEKTLKRPVIFEEKSYGGISPGTPGTVSSVFATEFDKMFVFADLKNDESASYSIFPMALDYGTREATLGYWFLLPHGSPRLIFLNGMRTQCESLIKKASKSSKKQLQAIPGQEMFLTSMAFLANGADTVILPRWNLSGSTPWRLMTHFVDQLPENKNSAYAWRKAILKLASSEISVNAEPRLAKSDDVEQISCSHPFFWAGYLLIDSGSGSLQSMERLEKLAAEKENASNLPPVNAPAKPRPLALPVPENEEEPNRQDSKISPANPAPQKPEGNGALAPLPPMGGSGNTQAVPMGGNVPVPLD
ncbi:MAG: CHAT domain-containing protein [Planctomycetaceae bacterium]|nr:CHAT domain-containing protein [Planctomycetaceae bacterium]